MDFNIDSFLTNLTEQTTPKAGGQRQQQNLNDNEKLNKIFVIMPDTFGTIYSIPMVANNGNPCEVIKDVREVKVKLKPEDEYDRWVRILPESYYNFIPGSREHQLYNEIVSLHETMRQKEVSWKLISRKNYTLMYTYILKHTNVGNQVKYSNVPALLVFNNIKIATALQSAIQGKIDLGQLEQLGTRFFNSDKDNRSGLMIIQYNKIGSGQQAQWTSNLNLTAINEDYFGLTGGQPTVNIPEVSYNAFGDRNIVNNFLNVDSDDKRFDFDFFTTVKLRMQEILNNHTGGAMVVNTPQVTQTVSTPQFQTPPVTTLEPITTPTPTPQAATQTNPFDNAGDGDLPF